MTGDYRSPIGRHLEESLRLLRAGPSAEVLAELERDARDLAEWLPRDTHIQQRAHELADRLRLLRVGLEHGAT